MRIGVADLENAARQRSDNIGNIAIRPNQYLVVTYSRTTGLFTYKWGRVELSRDGAIILLNDCT